MSRRGVLSRRAVLRGVAHGAAAAVALPVLECMLDSNGIAYAEDGAPLPVRYGTFFWGNGVRPDRWQPNIIGANWWQDPNEELAPIAESEAIRNRVSIFSNFALKLVEGTAHHKARAQMLTGTYQPSADGNCCGRVIGPSADWLIRNAWRGRSKLRDGLDVGISAQNKGGNMFNINRGCVFNDQGDAQPLEMSPQSVYDSLFGGGLPDDVSADDAEAFKTTRRSMLDVVREDASRLRTRLGNSDRRRLDDHLDHLQTIERGIDAYESASTCALPDGGVPLADDRFRRQVSIDRDGGNVTLTGELLTEKNAIMAELVALALACDLTRVFTFQHHGMQTDTLFWNLPGVSLGSHQSTHDDRAPQQGVSQARDFQAVHEIATYVMSQFRVLLEALAKLPEGSGDILDNTVIYATSEYADASSHSMNNMIALVAGGGGGVMRTGAHFDGEKRNAVEIPLTIMRALGLELDGFGQGQSRATNSYDPMLA
ncbi:MAG: DUF1552 domain-containing protein [Myxococcota bacterium]